ncbi:MAG: hypothetical protein QNJ18_13085 [Xenococcaceae cyanobacterium MO_167.B52]|nr:hypothetical protein [Xenococcaceae cyanobacterium MO_167.B52]
MNQKDKVQLSLHEAFNQGAAIAIDPVNNAAIQKEGQGTTTLSSYWLHQKCPVCSHTFRLGDEVYIDKNGIVRHNSVLLNCSENNSHKLDFSQETSAFFSGLDRAWPPPKDLPIVRLDEGHELLAAPLKGFQRHTCAVCSHTLRQNDRVVICPCSPHQPLCKIAVHRDLIHDLNCFEAWNPGANSQSYCPVTSRKLDE